MEKKIKDIVRLLCAHEISKSEAIKKLLNLHIDIELFSVLQVVEWDGLDYWVVEDNGGDRVLIANATHIEHPDYNDWWVDRDKLNAI